jgi:hypothetical protein
MKITVLGLLAILTAIIGAILLIQFLTGNDKQASRQIPPQT